MRLQALIAILGSAGTAACVSTIDFRQVQRIELAGRFELHSLGKSWTSVREPPAIDGEAMKKLSSTAECKNGTVLWKGGIPATLILRDGRRVRADGFSFYGHFLRISRKQWCEIPVDVWDALWRTR